MLMGFNSTPSEQIGLRPQYTVHISWYRPYTGGAKNMKSSQVTKYIRSYTHGQKYRMLEKKSCSIQTTKIQSLVSFPYKCHIVYTSWLMILIINQSNNSLYNTSLTYKEQLHTSIWKYQFSHVHNGFNGFLINTRNTSMIRYVRRVIENSCWNK